MRRKRLRRIGECACCGCMGPLTADHVPPRNLFPQPRPTDLITVPCCSPCNERFEKDDEYLRLVTAIRSDIGGHPDAREPLSAAMRSLHKPEKEGFRRAFLQGVKLVNAQTLAGIFLGRSMAYEVDSDRLNRTADRIVRGLFFHHREERLPDDAQVKALCLESIRSDRRTLQILEGTLSQLQEQPLITKGKGVFRYQFSLLEEDPSSSVWLFSFYEKVHFFGLTVRAIEATGGGGSSSANPGPQAGG